MGNEDKPRESRLYRPLTIALLLCLTALSALYLVFAPGQWWFSNDDAIYLGTAENVLRSGRYQFNGLPNLLVYPGTSLLLALALLIFGKNFAALHLLFVAIAVASMWMSLVAFRNAHGRLLALCVALLLGVNDIFISYVYYLRSEHLFLLLVLIALYAWQRFADDRRSTYLIILVVVTALAPIVRFEGLFLCLALLLALAWHDHREGQPWLRRAAWIGVLILTPFALWTLRNFLLYTPDAHNMALKFFFGLAGPVLYAGQVHSAELTSEWMYPVLRLMTLMTRLVNSVFELGDRNIGTLPMLLGGAFLFCFVIGIRSWFARASLLERCFFGLLFAFLLHKTLALGNTKSIVVHTRYFLVLLPFFFVIGLVGLRRLLRDFSARLSLSPAPSQTIGVVGLVFVLGTCGYFGVSRLLHYGSDHWLAYWDERHLAMARVREYSADSIPPEAVVAATDWGMVPYMTGRRTVTIIDSSELSLRRMADSNARYLVVFISTQAGMRPHRRFDRTMLIERHPYFQTATELVRDYPRIFEPVLDPIPSSAWNLVAIYKIHQDALQTTIRGN